MGRNSIWTNLRLWVDGMKFNLKSVLSTDGLAEERTSSWWRGDGCMNASILWLEFRLSDSITERSSRSVDQNSIRQPVVISYLVATSQSQPFIRKNRKGGVFYKYKNKAPKTRPWPKRPPRQCLPHLILCWEDLHRCHLSFSRIPPWLSPYEWGITRTKPLCSTASHQ